MKSAAVSAILFATALAGAGLFIPARASGKQGSSQGSPPPSAPSVEKQNTAPAGSHVHKITVKFDYDFTKTPSCAPPKVKDKCVAQFNVYDISAGVKNRSKLFSMPAAAGETARVTGITATSPARTFEPGRHLIGVATQEPNGTESDPRACTIWVDVP
jgi:hypothetical protein